jgi:predicted ATPase/DNA-binding SARP family transcriptional activator
LALSWFRSGLVVRLPERTAIAMWNLQLLGGLIAHSTERVVTRFRYHKAGSLLGYLAYFNSSNAPPHSRERLMEMLWPDTDPEAGHKYLRNLLSALRPVLEPPGVPPGAVLAADRYTVRLNPATVTCDVHQFEEAVRKANQPGLAGAERLRWWLQGAQLYQGALLPGYYEEWIGTEALRLSSLFLDVAMQAVPELLQTDQLDLALPIAQRAVATDPLSEAATWNLMRVLAAQRQPTQALRAYRQWERKLKEEWQETPSAEIQAYARQLRKSPMAPLAPPSPEAVTQGLLPARDAAYLVEPAERGERSARLRGAAFGVLTSTRFFGRERERGRLIQMLCTPRIRLITLVGPGGIGKTRLALETATQLMEQTTLQDVAPRGAAFVALADVTEPNRIGEAILRALGGRPIAGMNTLEQVSAALEGEPGLLLILDNFEQLAEAGAEVVGDLLARVSHLKCLVTSRQKLLIEGEHEFLLAPLPTTEGTLNPEALLGVPSIALFVDRAQMVRTDFQVTPHNASTLAELCAQLEGIPLAIELAAARVHLLSAAHILEQINQNRLDFLASRHRDATSRQRTLRTTLDWSYRLLAEGAQRLLAQVSVFRGGWTLEAAQAVCELSAADTLEMLSQLRDNSLLQVVDEEEGLRFTLLETVREYAAEHLERMVGQEAVQGRHARYFLTLAEEAAPALRGPEEGAILRRINLEQGNFRAAIDWTKAAGEIMLRARLGVALFHFWSILMGYAAELRQWLWDLKDKESNHLKGADMPPLLYGRLLYVLGRCARIQGDSDEANALYNQSLEFLQQEGDTLGIAWLLLYMGVHRADSDLTEAQKLFEESLRLMRQAGDEVGIATGLLGLTRVIRSRVSESREEYERAQRFCAEARDLCRRRGDLYGLAEILVEEGNLAQIQGKWSRAKACLEENLALRHQIGDRSGVGKALNYLGCFAHEAGDFDPARRYLEEAITVFQYCQWGSSSFAAEALLNLARTRYSLGDEREAEALAKQSLTLYRKRHARSGYHHCLQFLAELAASGNQPVRVVRLIGAAEAMRAAHGAGLGERAQEHLAQIKALLTTRLGEVRFADEELAGRALTDDEAIALALGDTA